MPRGRPKHPDILTPREWQVLDLLREGLTNEKIAQRLGISENGAKYHVLEILSKLGVSSRYEAAAWQREPAPVSRRYAGLAAIFAWRPPKLTAFPASKAAAIALSVGVFGFVGALALGVLVMNGRASDALDQGSSASSADLAPSTIASTATPIATATPPATATATLTPTPTPTAVPIATAAVDATLLPGAIAPPPGTAGPGYTPPPTATLPPNVLTELPVSASEALAMFALSQGTTYAGECSPAAQDGELCYTLQDATPLRQGIQILVRLRVIGQLLAYEVILAPGAGDDYEVASFSGPDSFTIEPPTTQ